MILEFNYTGHAQTNFLRSWDASWLSNFCEEDEVLFFGGNGTLRLHSIRIIETKDNYEKECRSLFYFDCMVSGVQLNSNHIQNKHDIKRIQECMEFYSSGEFLHNYDPIYQSFVVFYIDVLS
eukprot:133136_1